VTQFIHALEQIDTPIVMTAPNADTCGRMIKRHLTAFSLSSPQAVLVENLGTQAYFSMMAIAAAMVGNSSSGIIEAMSFHLPVVNVGTRQAGRVRAENVIDVGYETEEVLQGIRSALDPARRRMMDGRPNPYGDGKAASRILSRIKTVPLNDLLLRKRFGSDASVGIAPARGDVGG
jgi:UDP-N-acetylglucosamine 2-epimerase